MSQALLASEWLQSHLPVPAIARRGSAVSAESSIAREAVNGVVESVERSEALFGRKAATISQIWALANECAESGWDGDGAEPIDRLVAFAAADVIRALPGRIPLPDVAPEPDGSISLDWIQSKDNVFSLSVGASDRLAFAWLDGSDRGHGVVRFDGETMPVRALQGIAETMKHGRAALEPA